MGYKEGVFAEALRVFVYGATFLVAVSFASTVSPLLERHFSLDAELAKVAAMILLFIAAFLILRIVALVLLKVIKPAEGFLFNILGLAIGIGRWFVILSIAFMIIRTMNVPTLNADIGQKSKFAPTIAPIAPTAYEYLASVVPDLPPLPK